MTVCLSLFCFFLQHHAVVQEWSKTLPPHSSQLKKLLTIDVSRILSNPLVSSIVSSTAAALMSAPATPAHPEASPVGSTTPIQHSNSYTGLSSIPLGTASSASNALQSEDHSQLVTGGSELTTESMSSQQRSDAILSAVTSALTSTSVFSSRENRGRSNKALHWKCDLAGHTGAAYAIGFAPGSGRFLASGSFDKTVRVWDLWQAQTGGKAEVSAFAEHQLPVSALVWHSDAKHLVSGSFDQTVRVLDVESRRSARTLISAYCISRFSLTFHVLAGLRAASLSLVLCKVLPFTRFRIASCL
jgi:WD40 repeat protein